MTTDGWLLLAEVIVVLVIISIGAYRRKLRAGSLAGHEVRNKPSPFAFDPDSGNQQEQENQPQLYRGISRIFTKSETYLVLATIVLAAYTAKLADYTKELVSVADRTDSAVHESAKAAKSAANAASDANKLNAAGLRPWVTILVAIASPMTYDDKGAHLTLNTVTKNIGKTPAISILVDTRMTLLNDTIIAERDALCDRSRTAKETGFPITEDTGFLLFPEQELRSPRIVTMPPELVKFWRAAKEKRIAPAVIGCIQYRSTLLKEPHSTRFQWELDKTESQRDFITIDPSEGNIQADKLRLNSNPFLTWFAD